jgi:hypothetical protein
MTDISDEQIDALDKYCLSWLSPRGKESVREFARAVLALASEARAAPSPDAYVSIHPRNGPLWSNVITSLEQDRPSYPVRALYFAPVPAAREQEGRLGYDVSTPAPDLGPGYARIRPEHIEASATGAEPDREAFLSAHRALAQMALELADCLALLREHGIEPPTVTQSPLAPPPAD